MRTATSFSRINVCAPARRGTLTPRRESASLVILPARLAQVRLCRSAPNAVTTRGSTWKRHSISVRVSHQTLLPIHFRMRPSPGCPRGCTRCSSKDECFSCKSDGGYLLHGKTCVRECPYGMTFDGSAGCISCSVAHCAACLGGNNSCLRCNDGYYVNTGVCLSCHSSCARCDEGASSTSCTSCDFEKNGLTLSSNGQCVESCPQGFFRRKLDNTCQPCDFSCASCFGSSNSECKTCKVSNGFYLTYPSTCKACHGSCSTCGGPGFDSCVVCAKGFILLGDSVCVKVCPDMFFKSSMTGKCERCSGVCSTCSGPQKTDCNTCAQGYYKSVVRSEQAP